MKNDCKRRDDAKASRGTKVKKNVVASMLPRSITRSVMGLKSSKGSER
jgi:hypothetical protein